MHEEKFNNLDGCILQTERLHLLREVPGQHLVNPKINRGLFHSGHSLAEKEKGFSDPLLIQALARREQDGPGQIAERWAIPWRDPQGAREPPRLSAPGGAPYSPRRLSRTRSMAFPVWARGLLGSFSWPM